jgi:hypothetical protein
MTHWYGVVLHRDLRRSDLIRARKENFTKDSKAYVEKEWHKRPLLENIDAVLDYAIAADRHVPPRVIFAREGDLARQLVAVHVSEGIARDQTQTEHEDNELLESRCTVQGGWIGHRGIGCAS